MEDRLDIVVVGEERLVLEAIAAALDQLPGVRASWCHPHGVVDRAQPDVWLVDLSAAAVELRTSGILRGPVYALAPSHPTIGAPASGDVCPDVGLVDLAAWLRKAVTVEAPRSPGPPAPRPCPLSRREAQVLAALAAGLAPDAIGAELHVTDRTVLTHIQNAMGKMGVHTRRAAVDVALTAGWLNTPRDGASSS